jgi:hypothetical protein
MKSPQAGHRGKDSELRLILAMLLMTLAIASGVAMHRMRALAAEHPSESSPDDPDIPQTWPCELDAEKFCQNIPRGNGAVNACLDDHEAGLSPACSNYREHFDPPEVWSHICGQELQSFCSGRSQVITCLRENRQQLTIRCAGLLRRFEASAQWRRACGEDAQRLCPQHAGDAVAAEPCLRGRSDDLSTACRIYYSTR